MAAVQPGSMKRVRAVSMLNLSDLRSRARSLPRHDGEVFFFGDADFQSDVYDTPRDVVDAVEDVQSQTITSFQWAFEQCLKYSKILLVILTGCLSSIPFEMLLRIDPGASLFASFALHVYTVALAGPDSLTYIFSPKIPYTHHCFLVMLSFIFLRFKSYAVELLPMPLFIVFCNFQLVLSLIIGRLCFKKTFNWGQIASVLLVTAGCTVITLASVQPSPSASKSPQDILLGICYILIAVTALALLIPNGCLFVQRYNANPKEQIFMQHFLALPLFFLQWDKISPRFESMISTSTSVSTLAVLLVVSTIFAQINRYLTMVVSVDHGPLLCQLVLSVNKTIVLLVSLLYFNSPPYPTLSLWFGTVMQSVGSISYVQASFNESATNTFAPQSARRSTRQSPTGNGLLINSEQLSKLQSIASKQRSETPKHRSVSMSSINTINAEHSVDEILQLAKTRRAAHEDPCADTKATTRHVKFD